MEALSNSSPFGSSLNPPPEIKSEETEEIESTKKDKLAELNRKLAAHLLESTANYKRKLSGGDSNIIFEDVHQGNRAGCINFFVTANVEPQKHYKILSLCEVDTPEQTPNLERLVILIPDQKGWSVLKKNLNQIFQFIEEARLAKDTLLIHCESGTSRSGAVIVAYIMKSTGNSYDKVLEFVRTKRTFTNPDDDLKIGIIEYFKPLSLESMEKELELK